MNVKTGSPRPWVLASYDADRDLQLWCHATDQEIADAKEFGMPVWRYVQEWKNVSTKMRSKP